MQNNSVTQRIVKEHLAEKARLTAEKSRLAAAKKSKLNNILMPILVSSLLASGFIFYKYVLFPKAQSDKLNTISISEKDSIINVQNALLREKQLLDSMENLAKENQSKLQNQNSGNSSLRKERKSKSNSSTGDIKIGDGNTINGDINTGSINKVDVKIEGNGKVGNIITGGSNTIINEKK